MSRTAETLFARFLEAEDGIQFDTWVQGHPEHEADLRRIHAEWRLGGGLRKKGVSFFKSGEHAPPQPAPGLEAGKVIGDFRLVEMIGQGGMGQVWEAEQVSLRRRVAVKFVRPERVTEKQLDYFAREARAGGRLVHSGIVAVHGYGEDDGVAWIAMELVDGCWTLRDFLDDLVREGDIAEDYDEQVARFIARLADALQAAHEAGVIHRDLKPQNILIAPDQSPKVTDFGLARITDESALSETGDFAGTYFYMSPEQVAAKRMGIDHRTDIFSLGVVMYEMLALRRPFQGDTTHQVAQQIVLRDPPDVRVLRSRVPRDLAVICAKALEKETEKRFETMAALAADIERHLSNETIHAQPPTRIDRAFKWAKRNPTRSVAAVLVALAFVVISGLGLRLSRTNSALGARTDELTASNANLGNRTEELTEAVTALEAKTEEAKDEATRAEAARDRALRTQALFLADLADQELEANAPVTALCLALEALPADLDDPAPQAERALYRALYDLRELPGFPNAAAHRWVVPPPDAHLSPAGDLILTTAAPANSGLRASRVGLLWDFSGKQVGALRGHEQEIQDSAFSPDGQWILTRSTRTVRLWEDDGTPGTVLASNVVPDLRTILLGLEARPILLVGRIARSFDRDGLEINSTPAGQRILAFSADARYVLTAARYVKVDEASIAPEESWSATLWDMASGGHMVLDGGPGQLRQASFSIDGGSFATICDAKPRSHAAAGRPPQPLGYVIRLWNTYGEEVARLPEQASEGEAQPRVDVGPYGRRLITTVFANDRAQSILNDLGVVVGADARREWNDEGKLVSIATPSVKHAQLKLWNERGELILPLDDVSSTKPVMFSPTGWRLLASNVDGATSRLLDRDGTLVAELQGQGQAYGDTRDERTRRVFSPDESRVVTASADGRFWLWNQRGDKLAALAARGKGRAHAIFMADNRHLSLRDELGERMFAIEPLEIVTLGDPKGLTPGAGFSSDGDRVVTPTFRRTLREWDEHGSPVPPDRALPPRSLGLAYHSVLTFHADSAAVWRNDVGDRAVLRNEITAREISELQGKPGWIRVAAFGADGRRLITASEDGSVVLRDGDGKPLTRLLGHSKRVTLVEFNRDGSRILTGSDDGRAVLWDVDGVQLAVLLAGGKRVTHALFNPDGTRVLVAARGGDPELFDSEGSRLAKLDGHSGFIKEALFAPNGDRVLTMSSSRRTPPRLWSRDGELIGSLECPGERVETVQFGPGGQRLLTISRSGKARIWDDEGGAIAELTGHPGPVEFGAISPDGGLVLTASHDEQFRCVRLWSGDGVQVAELPGLEDRILRAGFSDNGERIFSSGPETVQLWDREGSELARLRGHGEVDHVGFRPGSARLRVVTDEVAARIWDLDGTPDESATPEMVCVQHKPLNSVDEANLLAIDSATKRILVVRSPRHTNASLWTFDGRQIAHLEHELLVTAGSLSPDGRMAITVTLDGAVRLWNDKGEQLALLFTHPIGDERRMPRFTPDSRHVAVFESAMAGRSPRLPRVRLWETYTDVRSGHFAGMELEGISTAELDLDNELKDLDPGGLKAQVMAKRFLGANFDPTGNRIVVFMRGSARQWDLQGEALQPVPISPEASYAAFTRDGGAVFTTTLKHVVHMDLPGTGQVTLKGHEQKVVGVELSPNKDRILTWSVDGTARLWNLNGFELVSFEMSAGRSADTRSMLNLSTNARFSPDGQYVLTVFQGQVRLFRSHDTESLIDRARTITPRWLDRKQRKAFFLDDTVGPVLDSLFEEHLLITEVVRALKTERLVPDDRLDEAVGRARARYDLDPETVNDFAWSVVNPGQGEHGDIQLALKLVRGAIKVEPTRAHFHDTLAWALLANGQGAEAIAASQRALELASDDRKVDYRGYLARISLGANALRSSPKGSENTR